MNVQADTPPIERRFKMSDGVELAADAWGDEQRPAAILLHGGGQTRHAWKRTAATLATHGYHAVAVDLRGHGDSGWSPDADYTSDRFAADVREIARSFPAKPVLIGASLGGVASLLAAGESETPIASALQFNSAEIRYRILMAARGLTQEQLDEPKLTTLRSQIAKIANASLESKMVRSVGFYRFAFTAM